MTIVSTAVIPRTDDKEEARRFYQRLVQLFSYHTGSGSPSGSITPRFIGDMYFDTAASNWYKATGITNTDWKAIT